MGKARRPVDFFTALRDVPVQQRHGVTRLTLDAYMEDLGRVGGTWKLQMAGLMVRADKGVRCPCPSKCITSDLTTNLKNVCPPQRHY